MTGSAPGEPAAATGGRWPLRAVSAATFLVLAGVVVTGSLVTLNVIRGQERLILRERTGEAAAVFGSAFSGSRTSLQLLGAPARSGQGRATLFDAAAHCRWPLSTSSTCC